MKRSEMVEHVVNQLKENGYEFVSVALVEDTLFAAQVSGMLPPSRRALSWQELGIIAPDDPEQPRFIVNKWSPEDET